MPDDEKSPLWEYLLYAVAMVAACVGSAFYPWGFAGVPL